MSKLSEDFRIGILGAAAGLFSTSITLLIGRIDHYYAYLASLDGTNYGAYHTVRELWWVPASVWHIILSVVASLVVHRYLTTQLRSPFLLWQVIGLTSIFGWALTFALVVSIDSVVSGDFNFVRQLPRSDEVLIVAKYVTTIFACNVLYGSVIGASSRQYLRLDGDLDHEGTNAQRFFVP